MMNETQKSICFWLAVMSHEHKPYYKEQLEAVSLCMKNSMG